MKDDQISAACERCFQNGGPRLYKLRDGREPVPVLDNSVRKELPWLEADESLWGRRKQRDGRYLFVKVGGAVATAIQPSA